MPTRILPPDFKLRLQKFLRTDDGSEQMAVNGGSSWAEDVWDGTGVSDSGTDWTRGGEGAESTDAAHSGTNGLNTGALSANDVFWFDYGSNRDLPSSFDSISFWINAQAYPLGSVLRCAWAPTGTMNVSGNSVKVTDYMSNTDLDVWHHVTIPLEDFNMSTNCGRFIFQAKNEDGQQFYLDDVDLLNSTSDGPYKFRVTGAAGELHHVSRITMTMSAPASNWNSDAFANIVSGLELGLILRQGIVSTQEIIWSVVCKTNIELFTSFVPSDPVTFADGEQMIVFTIEPGLASIVLGEDDGLEFIVRDDLSTLTNMRAGVQYGIEEGV